LRDLRGMTKDSDRLCERQNMPICSALRERAAAEVRVRDERVTGWKAGGRLRQSRQQKMPTCRMFSTGATGLEPATSGVTGRYGATSYNRLRPGIAGYSRHFRRSRTGSDRPRPATAR
jgi:hypothetical protein